MLRVIEKSRKEANIDVISTFCGAHSVPKGMTDEEATKVIIEEHLPKLEVKNKKNKAKTQQDLDAINSYLNSPLLKNEKSAKSTKALIIFHHCRSILYCRCQDNQSREAECLFLLDLMDKQPEFIEEMPNRYLTTLNNLKKLHLR